MIAKAQRIDGEGEVEKPVLLEDLGMIYTNCKSKQKRRYGLYKCPSCLQEYKANTASVNSGNSTQCIKCAKRGLRKHNDSNSKLYRVLASMISRCHNKKDKGYKEYGARGIIVCDEWKNNYSVFKEWSVSNGYSEGLSIDRIDNDRSYEPNNCRWVEEIIQHRNTRLLKSTNTSGYRGVSKKNGKFQSRICVNYERIHLGTFDYPYTAGYAYDSYVLMNNLEHTRNFKWINNDNS